MLLLVISGDVLLFFLAISKCPNLVLISLLFQFGD